MNHYDQELCGGTRRRRQQTAKPASPADNATRTTPAATRFSSKMKSTAVGVDAKYDEALGTYQSGFTWESEGSVAYWGVAHYGNADGLDFAGMDADNLDDELITDIAEKIKADLEDHGNNITRERYGRLKRCTRMGMKRNVLWHQDADDRESTLSSAAGGHGADRHQATYPNYVRSLIGKMPVDDGCKEWVTEMSPCLDWIGKPMSVQTELFMLAAFNADDLLYVYRKRKTDQWASPGVIGKTMMTAREWCDRIASRQMLPGDLIVPNPFTGNVGTTADGRPSLIASSCISRYPYLIVEFDNMPLTSQYALWRGFLLDGKLAPLLVSITHSGSKSLHALFYVGCKTLDGWKKWRQVFEAHFAADNTTLTITGADGKPKVVYPYRADVQVMHQRHGTRLPGVKRADKGTTQELIYLNPAARADNMWLTPAPKLPIDPNGKPPCGVAFGMGMCGVCDRLTDCPFVDHDAAPGTTLKIGAKR